MSLSSCCVQGFRWGGTPTGREGQLGANDTYIAGDNPDVAILLIHDLFGWKFPNLRLLADHWASEVGATAYLPDFFGGEVVDWGDIIAERLDKLDLPSFIGRNARDIREPEIFECARVLKQQQLGFKKVGAIGFCYGGWAVCRLAAREHQPSLVDCVSMGHPSLLTKEDIDGVAVPLQCLAPEHDPAYTAELKLYTFQTLLKHNIAFDYQHFPGVGHACFVRGDPEKPGEREAMLRAKNAATDFFKQWLLESKTT